MVSDDVVTRELTFQVRRTRRAAWRRELQQVCVELGLGCEVDEVARLLTSRFHVLVRGTEDAVAALLDYARVSDWQTVGPADDGR